jgi:putative ABC transport system ATP-binding protein/lipoprotein-releasing system ATP-binding protein
MHKDISLLKAENLVELRDVSCTYCISGQCLEAVAKASCKITAGQKIALIGASGSGKTTLLHILGGLIAPTDGNVSWPVIKAQHMEVKRCVAFIFQNPSLLPPLTVLENTELPMLLAGTGEKTARERAQAELKRVGMLALADKLPEELSGGQAQRVAAARALAVRPALLLADEPTGQLDRQSAKDLIDVILEAVQEGDGAVIVATHDGNVADRMQDLWKMNRGILEVRS